MGQAFHRWPETDGFNPGLAGVMGTVGAKGIMGNFWFEAGLKPEISHYAFCTNGSHYAGEAGIKTIGFGPSVESLAHVNDEYIEISQLSDACRGYYGILNAVLNGKIS